jgi:hypothetical protein
VKSKWSVKRVTAIVLMTPLGLAGVVLCLPFVLLVGLGSAIRAGVAALVDLAEDSQLRRS